MAEYLLDTNHCSIALLGDVRLINRLDPTDRDKIWVNAITVGELTDMMERSRDRETNLITLSNFLQRFRIHPIDTETAAIYGNLKATVFDRFAPKDRKQRRKTTLDSLGIWDNDLWIAATALQHGLTLVTADRDFTRLQPVCDLALETWI